MRKILTLSFVLLCSLASVAQAEDDWNQKFWELYRNGHKPDAALLSGPAVYVDGVTHFLQDGSVEREILGIAVAASPGQAEQNYVVSFMSTLGADDGYNYSYQCARFGVQALGDVYPSEMASLPIDGLRWWSEDDKHVVQTALFLRQVNDGHNEWLLGVRTCREPTGCLSIGFNQPASLTYWNVADRVKPSDSILNHRSPIDCDGSWSRKVPPPSTRSGGNHANPFPCRIGEPCSGSSSSRYGHCGGSDPMCYTISCGSPNDCLIGAGVTYHCAAMCR